MWVFCIGLKRRKVVNKSLLLFCFAHVLNLTMKKQVIEMNDFHRISSIQNQYIYQRVLIPFRLWKHLLLLLRKSFYAFQLAWKFTILKDCEHLTRFVGILLKPFCIMLGIVSFYHFIPS